MGNEKKGVYGGGSAPTSHPCDICAGKGSGARLPEGGHSLRAISRRLRLGVRHARTARIDRFSGGGDRGVEAYRCAEATHARLSICVERFHALLLDKGGSSPMTEEERFRENIRRDVERAERRAELAREFEQSPYAELTPETAYHFHRIGRPPQLRPASYLPAC